MGIRRRLGGHRGLLANPFVVLTDATVSLAFLFAIYATYAVTLSSRVTIYSDREERQKETQKAFLRALKHSYPQLTWEWDSKKELKDSHLYIYKGKGRKRSELLAELWLNASFQRLWIQTKMFEPNSAKPAKDTEALMVKIGEEIKPHSHHLSYVFLHGIAGTKQKDPDLVSIQMSSIVGAWWRKGVVGASSKGNPKIPSNKFIAMGTGKRMYPNEFEKGRPNLEKTGRVDVILFFNDVGIK